MVPAAGKLICPSFVPPRNESDVMAALSLVLSRIVRAVRGWVQRCRVSRGCFMCVFNSGQPVFYTTRNMYVMG